MNWDEYYTSWGDYYGGDALSVQEPPATFSSVGIDTEEVPVYYPQRIPVLVKIPVVVEHRYKHLYPKGHSKEENHWQQQGKRIRKQGWKFGFIGGSLLLLMLAIGGLNLVGNTKSKAAHSTSSSMANTVPENSGNYTVTAPNELSPDQINKILKYYGSSAQGEGQDIYDLGNQYGIDDIFFLADYRKESSFGNSTLASAPYYNPTGMECSDLAEGCTGADGNGRNWGTWSGYRAGYEAWFKQISQRYVSGAIDGGYKLTTIWLIACGPNGTGMYDGGSGCNQYAADIQGWVDSWRAGRM